MFGYLRFLRIRAAATTTATMTTALMAMYVVVAGASLGAGGVGAIVGAIVAVPGGVCVGDSVVGASVAGGVGETLGWAEAALT